MITPLRFTYLILFLCSCDGVAPLGSQRADKKSADDKPISQTDASEASTIATQESNDAKSKTDPLVTPETGKFDNTSCSEELPESIPLSEISGELKILATHGPYEEGIQFDSLTSLLESAKSEISVSCRILAVLPTFLANDPTSHHSFSISLSEDCPYTDTTPLAVSFQEVNLSCDQSTNTWVLKNDLIVEESAENSTDTAPPKKTGVAKYQCPDLPTSINLGTNKDCENQCKGQIQEITPFCDYDVYEVKGIVSGCFDGRKYCTILR